MQVFHCDHCQQLVFFENIACVNCQHPLAYLCDLQEVGSLEPTAAEGIWQSPVERASGRRYRLCSNYTERQVCNWAVPEADPNPLCPSCRLTRAFPDLTVPGNKEAWYKLEAAKRRLLYTLQWLGLTVVSKSEDPERGLAFEFLADAAGGPIVLTGHAEGVITVNIAEADDAEREKRRVDLREPFRTLLGHFRHEIGHYYWERLVRDSEQLEGFREIFGDERSDYAEALQRYYRDGPPADWQERYVSAYASGHPWEDWAETWAHYLHMVDSLETAAACGLSLRPRRSDEPVLPRVIDPLRQSNSFEKLIADWHPVTYLLNNLNRGLGLPDGYPFVLSAPARAKLRFVHETILAAAAVALSSSRT